MQDDAKGPICQHAVLFPGVGEASKGAYLHPRTKVLEQVIKRVQERENGKKD